MTAWIGRPAVALLLLAGACSANTYTVVDDGDDGVGTLRWAVRRTNTHAGADAITLAKGMVGRKIRLLTRLPAISDAHTTIDGDVNNDGSPDVTLDGDLLDDPARDNGLTVSASDCTISGLVIRGFPASGIEVVDTSRCRITGCHLGLDRLGTTRKSNGRYDIRLLRADWCMVGGPSAAERNLIIGASEGDVSQQTITIEGGRYNSVVGNVIGVGSDGVPPYGYEAWVGVLIKASHDVEPARPARGNIIGGAAPGAGNVIDDVHVGVLLTEGPVRDTVVAGNLFGLAPDGDTPVRIRARCIELDSTGVHDTLIGGSEPGARNVFAQCTYGIVVEDLGLGNRIQGNRFGTNAAGTEQRDLETGIRIWEGAHGALTIGGSSKAAGNQFAPYDAAGGTGVDFPGGANAPITVTIRYNTFGRLPGGSAATGMLVGVLADGTQPTIEDNLIVNALAAGIAAQKSSASPRIFRNEFRDCHWGVYVADDARCRLGNLGNAASYDDGGNIFRGSNLWHIYNATANSIRAEGNDFITTSRAEIDAKIHDQLDHPSLGLVDYDPMATGVHPTVAEARLALLGVAAVPTRQGAEVTFTLSGGAEVTAEAVNLAGRPVATLARDLALAPGLNRLSWTGCTDGGTQAPPGRYLIRVLARDAAGRQATALCATQLR